MRETRGLLTVWAQERHSPDRRRHNEAARHPWVHFGGRLEAIVAPPGSTRGSSMVAGAEDVVQSFFASFFAAEPGSAGPPGNREQLWRLLVRFTMCKIANTAERHRDGRRERLRAYSTPAATDSGSSLKCVLALYQGGFVLGK